MLEGTKYTPASINDYNEGIKSINELNGYNDAIKENGVLCWFGYVKCNIDFNRFSAFFESYIENTTLDMNNLFIMQIMKE